MTEGLDVYLYSAHVARLTRHGPGQYELDYRPEWVDDEAAMPISLSLPLIDGTHQGDVLTAFLDNLLPDNADVRERWALQAGLPTTEPFGLLRDYGRDVAGAIQFVDEGEDPNAGRATTPLDEAGIAERIRAIRDDDTRWQNLDGQPGYFSLGGAQGKFALGNVGQGWYEPVGGEPTTHIFKPGVRGQVDGEIIEHLTMLTARTLGLAAAHTEMLSFRDEHSLVVTRFDRATSPEGVIRLHQEDLAQALGLTRLQKYEFRGGPNYRQVLDLLRPASESRESFVRALVFSWMVLNTDAHAKNYSIFITPGGIRLTPLYDVSSLLPYLGRPGDDDSAIGAAIYGTRLSMRIAADYEVGEQSWFEWEAVAREAGIDVQALGDWAEDAALLIPAIVEGFAAELPPALQSEVVHRFIDHAVIRGGQLRRAVTRRS